MTCHKCLSGWVVAVLFVLGTALAQSQAPIYVSDNTVLLGNVKQGDVLEHRFLIRNPEHSSVKIRIADLSLPGLKARMPQEIPAGDRGWITVTWDTRSVQGDMTAEVLLRIDEKESVILSLSAMVIPPVAILPYPAVFMSGFRDESVKRTLEIVNNDTRPLNIVRLARENGDSFQSYSAAVRTLEPGRRYELDIELKPTAPMGKSQDTLNVMTDYPGSAVIHIPVNLLVKTDVYVNPEAVDFGLVTAQTPSSESFMLKTRRRPIKVLAVTSDLSFLRVSTGDPDTPQWTHEFKVEIDGKLASGPFSGMIYIKTDDPSFPEMKASVEGEAR